MTAPSEPGYTIWNGKFDSATGDIQIDVETNDGNKTVKGKILMVGGRVMAMQGPIAEPGYEIDALDAPILEQQLVTRLLGEAQD